MKKQAILSSVLPAYGLAAGRALRSSALLSVAGCLLSSVLVAQTPPTAPIPAPGSYTTAPAYPAPYNPAKEADIKAVLDRVLAYLDTATPLRVVDRATGAPVTDFTALPANPVFERTDFLVFSYEWGVTYSGMLRAAAVTGDAH